MRPIFFSQDVEIYGQPRIVGKDHLKLKLRQDGQVFDSIGFNLGKHLSKIQGPNKRADVLFTIEDNRWNGSVFPQLKIKDIRVANEERTHTEILTRMTKNITAS